MASQDWFDKDFYKVLGVAKDVSDADLKKTYRKLARKYHPDSNPGDAAAEAKFKEMSEAYAVLSDREQREEYDQIRAMGSGARFQAPGSGGGGGGFEDVFSRFGQGRGGTSQADFDDIFAMFGQQGGGFGSGRFGQSTGGFRGFGGPQRGADVSARTTIDFVTATKGDTISLQGEDGKPFKVKIPAGVKDGQKIKLRGRGRPSPDGGEPGDIVVSVTVRPHSVFTRDGLNLRVTVPVTFTEAALGATIEVPTLDGEPVRLRVAPGTPLMAVIPLQDVWVDANFKETQLQKLRLGQRVELTSELYGEDVVYHGTLQSLGLGTGAAFSILPAQNASGNWIKIVQRVPVRVALDPKELREHPLRLGLSMSAKVNLHDKGDGLLPTAPSSAPATGTDAYARLMHDADAKVDAVIDANLGHARG